VLPSSSAVDALQTRSDEIKKFFITVTDLERIAGDRLRSHEAAAAKESANADAMKKNDAALTTAVNEAQKKYEQVKRELDVLYPSYTAALDARSAYVACLIMKEFGAGVTCGSALVDEINRQTILKYKAKAAEVDAAMQVWRTALAASAANALSVGRAQQQLALAQGRASIASQNSQNLRSVKGEATAETERLDSAAQSMAELEPMVQQHEKLQALATAALSRLQKSKSGNWVSAYSESYAVAKVTARHLTGLRQLAARANVSLGAIPKLPEGAWLPSDFFQASRYSDVKRPVSVDFGWKWSGGQGCGGKPCSIALMATNRTCLGGVVTMEYRKDSGEVEATSTSAKFDILAGEISIVQVESRFSETAKNGYLVGLACDSLGQSATL
jgi:hypothetical protein